MQEIKIENKAKERLESNLKGAMAEQLTMELLIDAGYTVYHYGVEHLVPGFMPRGESVKKDLNHVTNNVIRNLPDFLVVKDGKSYYIETKFRSEGKLEIKPNYPFPSAYFIVFSKDDIYMIKAKNGMNKEKLIPIEKNNLLKLKSQTIKACKELLIKYFTPTTENN